MKYLFYFGHPAQYLFLRETIKRLSESDRNQITILIKTKDVLEALVQRDGFEYTNILAKHRGSTRFSVGLSLLKRITVLIPIVLRVKPDLLIGTDATIAQIGRLLGINRITVLEDDYDVIRNLARLTYPFTQTILCPEVCQVGQWGAKKIGYRGYMKLGYLHPAVFTPNKKVPLAYKLQGKFVLIRLSRLVAHHDVGIRGIHMELVNKLISVVEAKGLDVKISAEGDLDKRFERYALTIDPGDMHHVLAEACLLICDSQSMSVEAAILGVPSVRYSDFAGKISVLEELEHTYQLTFGIQPGHEEELLTRLETLLEQPDLKTAFLARRQKMLSEKIDVTSFLVWFLEHYPHSETMMKENPDYQSVFEEYSVSDPL
ncbi:DUF354 domain-containing protein [Nostoc sp. CHAB 5834]|nr:DUF354 domain-containing protein [Nostoc sp. CHAB 5834]